MQITSLQHRDSDTVGLNFPVFCLFACFIYSVCDIY